MANRTPNQLLSDNPITPVAGVSIPAMEAAGTAGAIDAGNFATSAHAATHAAGGADEVNGCGLACTYTPSNFSNGAGGDTILGKVQGIDAKLAGGANSFVAQDGSGNASVSGTLNVAGNFSVGTTKLTVATADGSLNFNSGTVTLSGTTGNFVSPNLNFDGILDAGTGNEVAYNLTPTVNKATSGDYTALNVNVTETSAPGTANKLASFGIGGTPVVTLFSSGILTTSAAGSSSAPALAVRDTATGVYSPASNQVSLVANASALLWDGANSRLRVPAICGRQDSALTITCDDVSSGTAPFLTLRSGGNTSGDGADLVLESGQGGGTGDGGDVAIQALGAGGGSGAGGNVTLTAPEGNIVLKAAETGGAVNIQTTATLDVGAINSGAGGTPWAHDGSFSVTPRSLGTSTFTINSDDAGKTCFWTGTSTGVAGTIAAGSPGQVTTIVLTGTAGTITFSGSGVTVEPLRGKTLTTNAPGASDAVVVSIIYDSAGTYAVVVGDLA